LAGVLTAPTHGIAFVHIDLKLVGGAAMFGKNICGSKLELRLFLEIFAADRWQDLTNESQGKINADARFRYLLTKKETL
jgi:hypothetical protein